MALLPPGSGGPLKKKKVKPKPFGAMTPEEQIALAPGAPVIPGQSWADLINADPLLIGEIGDINAGGVSDKANTMAALRAALIKMGGKGLSDIVGKLGGDWAELLDPTTIEAAAAGDTAGTSLQAQLDKRHADRLLAEEDIRAAKGMLSSGQSGYEMGQARQDNTIAQNNALDSLLEALRGGIGQFTDRENERIRQRSSARGAAGQRAIDLGLTPAPQQVLAPPTPPSLIPQLRRNARRPIRRPIRGYE